MASSSPSAASQWAANWTSSGSAATPVYKTDQTDEIRKELTGASKSFMVAAESIEASTAGRDVLAAGDAGICDASVPGRRASRAEWRRGGGGP